MNELVSIIMPCHNGAKYIKEAINSVISQTYQNWELLVVDDNSVDDSSNIIESFVKMDSRIQLYKNLNCTGLPASPRNLGIQNAHGRYIAFLDCDDKWFPTKLEQQVVLFDDKKCAIVFSYYKKMDENGVVSKSIVKSPSIVSYNKLLNGDCIGNLTGVYDTEKVGKILQKEIHAEDYLMWLEILKKGFLALNTNTVEAIYRVSANSISGNKLKSAIWNWNIYKNELHLHLITAMYHFLLYIIKGVFKFLK